MLWNEPRLVTPFYDENVYIWSYSHPIYLPQVHKPTTPPPPPPGGTFLSPRTETLSTSQR